MKTFAWVKFHSINIVLVLTSFVLQAQNSTEGFRFSAARQMLGPVRINYDDRTVSYDGPGLEFTSGTVATDYNDYHFVAGLVNDGLNPFRAHKLALINLGEKLGGDAANPEAGKPKAQIANNFTPSAEGMLNARPAMATTSYTYGNPRTGVFTKDILFVFSINEFTKAVNYCVVDDPVTGKLTEPKELPAFKGIACTQITACRMLSGSVLLVASNSVGGLVYVVLTAVQLSGNPVLECASPSCAVAPLGNEYASNDEISVTPVRADNYRPGDYQGNFLLAWVSRENTPNINYAEFRLASDNAAPKEISKVLFSLQSGDRGKRLTVYKENADTDEKMMHLFWYNAAASNISHAYGHYGSFSTFLSVTSIPASAGLNDSKGVSVFPLPSGFALVTAQLNVPLGSSMQMGKVRAFEYSKWMGAFLTDELTLKDISIPGSHNAGMNEEQYWGATNFIVSNGICNNCNAITQRYTIENQLEYGYRYIDTKLAYNDNILTPQDRGKLFTAKDCFNKDLTAVSACSGTLFEEALEQITKFLAANPSEVVILNVSALDESNALIDGANLINEKCRDFLYSPPTNINTLNDLVNVPIGKLRGKLVVTSASNHFVATVKGALDDIFETSSDNGFHSYSSNTRSGNDLLSAQERFLTNPRYAGNYKRLDWQVNPVSAIVQCDLKPLQVCLTEKPKRGFWHHLLYYMECAWEVAEASETLMELGESDGVSFVSWVLSGFAGTVMDEVNSINKLLPGSIAQWRDRGIVSKKNKANIVFTDASASWVTDLCLDMTLENTDIWGDASLHNSILKVSPLLLQDGCTTDSTGSVTVHVEGGQPPYKYYWVQTGDTTATAHHLAQGTYRVQVTDSWGRKVTKTMQVGESGASYKNLAAHLAGVTEYQALYEKNNYAVDCDGLLATLESDRGEYALQDTVTVKLWVNEQGANYMARHLHIQPKTNPELATAKVTLYFAQADFDRYNAISPSYPAPAGPQDQAGISNLHIVRRPGNSADGSGNFNSYSTKAAEIHPAEGDVIWNPEKARWEVSFFTRGFGGFFVSTHNGGLPMQLTLTALQQGNDAPLLQWQVQEKNARGYYLEYAFDNRLFAAANYQAANGLGLQTYQYSHATSFPAGKQVVYYRVRLVLNNGETVLSNVVPLNITQNKNLAVYPNPFTTEINILAKMPETVVIIDPSGRVIKTIQLTAGINKIYTAQWPAGMYILSTRGKENYKLIK